MEHFSCVRTPLSAYAADTGNKASKPRWQKVDGKIQKRDHGGKPTPLRCRRCAEPITERELHVERLGLSRHSQVNPHGFIWQFDCYAAAVGCQLIGKRHSEFSWFAGYTWQLADCSGCGGHLGWRFDSPDDSFWGLICERIV